MGHIFQINRRTKMASMGRISGILMLVLLPLAWANTGSTAVTQEYEYKQKDKAEEKKRSIQRLERDKHRVAMAIETTNTLIDRSRHRPYLPELYLRLAELYIEQSRIVYLLRKNQHADKDRALDQLESNSLKKRAVEIYQRILSHFPEFEQRDKVYFFMAHEYGELGKLEDMVNQYRTLIAKHKDSQYTPEAYLLLGDYFFSRQNLPHAQKHYRAVIDYPESSASVIARYKLGWCYINTADYPRALKLFEEAVEHSSEDQKVNIDTYRHVNVRLEALIDMAYCYPEVFKKSGPQEALTYFQKYAWSRQAYTTVMEKLANRYFIKKKWMHAASFYRQLADLRHDPERLMEYASNIYECVQAIGTYKDIDQDVKLIVKALEQQKYSIHVPDEEKAKNIKDFEIYARDVITHLHDKARKKKSKAEFKQAASAYELYLEFFKESPARTQMQANYAEALFASQQYLEAGKQYEELTQNAAQPSKQDEDKLYSSVIAYYQAIKNKDELNYYQLAWAREGLRTTGKQYVAAFPRSKRANDVRFNVAWIAYDAGKLDEAITEFSEFTKKYPNSRAAKAATHLILDAYFQKEDFKGLAEYGNQVLRSGQIKDPKFKQEVAQIVQGAESKVVSAITLSAVDDWDKGKSDLIELANKGSKSGVNEQALNALIVAAKEKNDLDTLFTAGSSLVARFPKSAQVENTLNLMIDTSLRTQQYRLLADFLESFSRTLPNHKNTQDFMYQAAQIRQGLGQYQRANAIYRRLLRRRVANGSKRDEIIFAMADNAERQGQSNAAIKILGSNSKLLTRNASIRANAKMADLYLEAGNIKQANRYRQRALKSFKPHMAQSDVDLKDAVAQMDYNNVRRTSGRYFNLQLKGRLDDKIVAAKKKQLEKLEKGYQRVLKYQSPPWALRACYRMAELNQEFARFLKESPIPALSPEQKKQYIQLLDKKAQQYSKKAEKYYQTCLQLAHKWEICDPKLVGYFSGSGTFENPDRQFQNFAGVRSGAGISVQSLKDPAIKQLHDQLMTQPDDMQLYLALADGYLKKGDYRQAALIAQNALGKGKRNRKAVIAQLHNTLGVSWLYLGEDELAKDSFKQAMQLHAANMAASINLAGLYQFYGHSNKAKRLYANTKNINTNDPSHGRIHPRAGDLYNANYKISKN